MQGNQSDPVDEQESEWTEFEPCPACGSHELDQQVQSWEKIDVSSDGDILAMEQYDEITVLVIECANCEEVLHER